MDHPHQYISDQIACRRAEGGEQFSIALEVYGGTPLPDHPSRPVFPEAGVAFTRTGPAVTGVSTFGWWNEEAYQLWLDLTVLRDVHDYLDPHDGFREALADGFARLLDTLDAELPLPDRRQAYLEARRLIAPLMNAHNGTYAASMGVIANSHLDLAWLWPMAETRRKTARTFGAVLRLLREYRLPGTVCGVCCLKRSLLDLCAVERGEIETRLLHVSLRGAAEEVFSSPLVPASLCPLPGNGCAVGCMGRVLFLSAGYKTVGTLSCPCPVRLRPTRRGVLICDPCQGTAALAGGPVLYRGPSPQDAVMVC